MKTGCSGVWRYKPKLSRTRSLLAAQDTDSHHSNLIAGRQGGAMRLVSWDKESLRNDKITVVEGVYRWG